MRSHLVVPFKIGPSLLCGWAHLSRFESGCQVESIPVHTKSFVVHRTFVTTNRAQ